MTDTPAERLLIISVIYDLQHRLCMTGPRPVQGGQSKPQSTDLPDFYTIFKTAHKTSHIFSFYFLDGIRGHTLSLMEKKM